MLLSGICLMAAAAFTWSFVRYSTGLRAYEEKVELKSDSDKTSLMNRARRGVRSIARSLARSLARWGTLLHWW